LLDKYCVPYITVCLRSSLGARDREDFGESVHGFFIPDLSQFINHSLKSSVDKWSGPFIKMPKSTPEFFSSLSESDQIGYLTLQAEIRSLTEKRRRGRRVPIFAETLNRIREWAQRGDSGDSMRCLVCGLYSLSSGLAVNSHQLRFLTRTCKSAINGALKIMGYKTISARGDVNPQLVAALPFLEGKTHALRQWSVRSAVKETVDEAKEAPEEPAVQEISAPHSVRPSDDPNDSFGQSQDDTWPWPNYMF
jgi:hypothetical protein